MMPIRAFTMPIRLFTMADPAVHEMVEGQDLVRGTAAWTIPRLSSVIRRACRAISSSDAVAWLRHCGVGKRR